MAVTFLRAHHNTFVAKLLEIQTVLDTCEGMDLCEALSVWRSARRRKPIADIHGKITPGITADYRANSNLLPCCRSQASCWSLVLQI